MKFLGEILILLLLLITNLRVFFVEHVRRDPLVSLAPFTFVLSILQIFAWKIEVVTVFTFLLATLVFLSNFHALFRYSEQLYVDHYSILMKCWAIITVLLSIAGIAFTVYFSPLELNNQKIQVSQKTIRYKGSFRSGFEKTGIFRTSDAIIYEYSPEAPLGEAKPEPKEIILFFPDKRADTYHYTPFLQLMAKEGYYIYSADFFADDVRWMHSFEDLKILRRISAVIQSYLNPQKFMAQKEFYNYNISLECKALLNMVDSAYNSNTKYYLISDVMGTTAIKDFSAKNQSKIKGTFSINSIPEYKTPGYGCVEQTDPLLATFLGFKADHSMETPKILVEKTKAFLEENNDSDRTE